MQSGHPAQPPGTVTFEEVYQAHFRLVWRALSRLGVRNADLMDVSQNVFLVVHRQLSTFEGRAELTTWLFSICRLVAKDYLRSAPIRREVVIDMRRLARSGGPGESPLQRLATLDLSQLLEAILSKMPAKLSAVFVMFELDELSGEEIAHILGVPVGTVRSRLRLARAAFQREVGIRGAAPVESPLAERARAPSPLWAGSHAVRTPGM
jgi:RNA polymerase sigma-70 factor (ECF subfamily)